MPAAIDSNECIIEGGNRLGNWLHQAMVRRKGDFPLKKRVYHITSTSG